MKFVAMLNQRIAGVGNDRVVSGGSPGELSAIELGKFIQAKSQRQISDQAAQDCARAILDHPGGNAAGEALGAYKYKGNAIYHHTRNKPSAQYGCTVFFSDGGNGYAKLVAIGNHIGTKPNVYALDWVSGNFSRWKAGTRILIG